MNRLEAVSRNFALRFAAAVVLAGSLAACQDAAALDIPPPDSGWQPQDINAANIAAMAARPRDLVSGLGDRAGSGRAAAVPVLRLWQDRVKPLPIDQGAAMSGDSAAASAPPASGAPPAAGTGGQ